MKDNESQTSDLEVDGEIDLGGIIAASKSLNCPFFECDASY